MLRSKFWTGLKSQELRSSTRHLYDSVKDFQLLLKEIRKVEQEIENGKRPVPPITSVPNKKIAQQHSGQVQSDSTNEQLLKQMSELMSRMKALEQKYESHQNQNIGGNNAQPQSLQYQNSQSKRGNGRGYGRGQWRGTCSYGRGFQTFNRGGNRGGNSGGRGRGGTSARGTHQGGNHNGSNQPLNF